MKTLEIFWYGKILHDLMVSEDRILERYLGDVQSGYLTENKETSERR